jgi:hypothetical protein
MNIDIEKKIAKSFIFPNKQERFLFDMARKSKETFAELPKPRFEAICRLENIIDASYAIMKSKQNPTPVQLIKTMSEYGVGKMCYVISEYKDFDGVYIELRLAAEKLQWNGFPSLIVGLPSGFAHFKYESYASSQPNCFLKPTIRFDGVPWK